VPKILKLCLVIDLLNMYVECKSGKFMFSFWFDGNY
jgi:hypothetical protein